MHPLGIFFLRLLYAVLIGGIIGAEREYRSKSAGFRTMMLICVGAFLFTTFSRYISPATPDRIASNIVTGIGFLGAGVIYRSDNKVSGITTAATIWITAALGIGIALGHYGSVFVSAVFVFILLFLFLKIERYIDRYNQARYYRIVTDYSPDTLSQYEQMFKDHHLTFKRSKQIRTGDEVVGTWHVQGSEDNHNLMIEKILNDKSVRQFEF